MAPISMEAQGRNPADHLTDDIILEILSRLPVKSICRFKCVSRAWRNLISHPDHRKKLPQTLSGFFYYTYSRERFPESARHFTNITGRGPPLVPPSLSFLPSYRDITILDCCNGVLLCRGCTEGAIRYVVCNPATEEWTELPESGTTGNICTARLGFDLAVSPHFHVFEFLETDVNLANGDVFVVGLEIYSSNTGEWAHRDSGWSDDATLNYDMSSVFLKGFLHVLASEHQVVLVVDTEGKVWRTIAVPSGAHDGFIGQSQGCLYYINTVEDDFELSVYVLEDHATDEWVFKHSVMMSTLLGKSIYSCMQCYNLAAIHPEGNWIFFISDVDDSLRCYNMRHKKVHVIRKIGCPRQWEERCLPYVPLYSKSLTGQN